MWSVFNKNKSTKDALCDESWGKESPSRERAINPTRCICHSLNRTSLPAVNSRRTFYTQFPHLLNLDGSLQGMGGNYLAASLSNKNWVLFPSYSKLSLLWIHTGQKQSSPLLAVILSIAPPGRKVSSLKTTMYNSNILTLSPVWQFGCKSSQEQSDPPVLYLANFWEIKMLQAFLDSHQVSLPSQILKLKWVTNG